MAINPLCCEFTYDSVRDWGVTRTARGVECSWTDLSRKFFLQGPQCSAIDARHFRTISVLGPKLFAASLANFQIFYHDGHQWHQYESARGVRFGGLKDFRDSFHDDDTDDYDFSQQESDENNRDNDGGDHGQQAKDSGSSGNSTNQVDPAILHYYVLRILLLVRLHIYLIPNQLFMHSLFLVYLYNTHILLLPYSFLLKNCINLTESNFFVHSNFCSYQQLKAKSYLSQTLDLFFLFFSLSLSLRLSEKSAHISDDYLKYKREIFVIVISFVFNLKWR